MLELGIAGLSGVLALVAWLRWQPTLRQRIQEHAALVKDLDADTGGPLRDLLRREIAELSRRDSRAFQDRNERREKFQQLSPLMWMSVSVGAAIYAVIRAVEDRDSEIGLPVSVVLLVFTSLSLIYIFWRLKRSST